MTVFTSYRYLLEDPLTTGNHVHPSAGMCIQEWLRLHEGQDFCDDALPCQSEELMVLLMSLNDRMPHEPRQQLKALGLRTLGTANDGKAEERMFRITDWVLRELVPSALEEVLTLSAKESYTEVAASLRALAPITDADRAHAARLITMTPLLGHEVILRADRLACQASYSVTLTPSFVISSAARAIQGASCVLGDAAWDSALQLLDEILPGDEIFPEEILRALSSISDEAPMSSIKDEAPRSPLCLVT